MVEVDVIVTNEASHLFSLDAVRLQNFAVQVLKYMGISESEVNIVFIDDVKMTELNENFKKHPGTTDVLSFILSEEHEDKIEGEVYISLEMAREQSVEYDVPFEEEVVRLVTHGLLHLKGLVHDTDESSKVMDEKTEMWIQLFFNDGEEK